MLTCLKASSQALRALVDANQLQPGGLTYNSTVKTMKVRAMLFHSNELGDELEVLKNEVSRLLNDKGEEMFDAAKTRADALADQIKGALSELGETLSEQEDHVEALIGERPIVTMASALALGIVIGFMLRRH